MARSAWMSWLVILTIAVSLSILGGAWQLVQDLGNVSTTIGGQLTIQVFLSDDADPKSIMSAVQALPDVKGVSFKTKEQNWQEFQTSMRAKDTFGTLLDENPLPNTLTVTSDDPDKTIALAERIHKMPGVEDDYVAVELLKKLSEIAFTIRTAGGGISGLLGLASLAIIMNTIRLAVMARKREIEIMHLVGASSAFIAWPFLLEGMLFGVFATILTGGVMMGWRYFTFMKWQELFPFLPITLDYMPTVQMLIWLAIIGMGVGMLGSLLAVRKHIRQAMAD